MGALKIDCYCNENQMSNILSLLTKHLSDADRYGIDDFDDVIDDLRVCVEFETYMDTIRLKTSEILDSDWEILYEDTAVFTSRLRSIVDGYNKNRKEAIYQAHHIINDRRF
ncbi:MAG: hypothetical protein E6767_16275 [Dysgonomonas sp.]|nr:hypothetical protein [Dysgonomonas sp.]